jgi:exopolysaccharide biosynthesis WecB/TagA/CpsF family protein
MYIYSENFFGLKVSNFSETDLKIFIQKAFESKNSKIFYGYSLAVLSYLRKYPGYYKTTSQFDLMVTDGRLFYILARAFGINLQYDISIPRLTILTLNILNENKLKLLLVGGSKDTNILANNNIRIEFPNIDIIEGIDGYNGVEDKKRLYDYVIKTKPNLILLGLPTPLKQELALELRPLIDNCVIIPCGGMINVFAGKEKLTPIWLKKIGLASLYRHIQHPKRLPELFSIYFKTVTVFGYCAYLKFIKKQPNISIPHIIDKTNS